MTTWGRHMASGDIRSGGGRYECPSWGAVNERVTRSKRSRLRGQLHRLPRL